MSQIHPPYYGLCSICGEKGTFAHVPDKSVRESYPCPSCRATVRYRDQASLIIDEFGDGTQISVRSLAASGLLDDKVIYEPALIGPFVSAFSDLPNYQRSFFWPGAKPGDHRNGVAFQDLTSLTMADGSVDLVISSDVMEHVFNPWRAFEEIARILKMGGVHIFSVPMNWPPPPVSTEKARLSKGEIIHLGPPRYHRSGDGSDSLVVTDYGTDIITRLRIFDLETRIVRRQSALAPAYQNATFISRRVR